MTNYPPGVTGGEYQIAGPDREWEETRECPECGDVHVFLMQSYRRELWGYATEHGDTSIDFPEEYDDDA